MGVNNFIKKEFIFVIIITTAFFGSTKIANATVSPVIDDHSITMMSTSMNVAIQNDWSFQNSGDSPEGAYMGWLYNNAPTNSTTVTLPQQLTPGRYYVFLKGISYDNNLSIKVTIGGVDSSTVTADDRDTNKYWTERMVIDITTPSDTVLITLTRNDEVLVANQKLLLRGLYITSDNLETVNRDDVIIKLVYPTVMDDSDPVKGNLVVNSGFEAGIDASWGFDAAKSIPVNTTLDGTTSHSGYNSLKLPISSTTNVYGVNTGLYSKVYRLKPNKKYSLSMWMKCSNGKSATVSIRLTNIYTPPEGYPAQYYISNSSTFDGTWKRLSVTGYALEYVTGDYQILISANDSADNYLYIDDVQLEEGELTDYQASTDLEAGITISNIPGNAFYTDDTMSGTLTLRNNGTTTQSGYMRYEIFDYFNQLIREGTTTISSLAASTSENSTFDLSVSEKKGIFRIVYWIRDQSNTKRELAYSVVPRPAVVGVDQDSVMGIHPNYISDQLTLHERLGIKWARVLSPSAFFRWSVIEPNEGEFIWHDAELQLGATHNITTMGTIGTNDYWPAWADNGGLPDLTKWGTFVGQLVNHYKSMVQYWEIWNEPGFTSDFYAQMLKMATDAIEAEDPNAKIIGMGGLSLTRVQGIITSLETLYPAWDWKQHIDIISTHAYPGAEPELFTSPIIETENIPVWNTETGAWDRGFYQGTNSNFAVYGKNIWSYSDAKRYYDGMTGSANLVVQNFARTITSGITKYFYYDSRVAAAPNYFLTHPTIREYDGTLRAKGVAYIIAGSFIDHSIGFGDFSPDLNSFILLFDKSAVPVVTLFSKDKSSKQITLSLNSSQMKVYDIMGNEISISGGVVPYGRNMVYIVGQGISTTTMKTAIENGVVTSRSDGQAPNVSISDLPEGRVYGGAFRARWIALDDTSYPNLGEVNPETNVAIDSPKPEALLYSYRLDPYSTWSSWIPNTYADYNGISDGTYSFDVKAKDEVGNISSVVSKVVLVGDAVVATPTPAPTPTPNPSGGGGGGGGGGGSSIILPYISTTTLNVLATSTCKTIIYPTLSKNLTMGSFGNDVLLLNKILNAEKVLLLSTTTSVYDKNTTLAVSIFQKKYGIVSSGTPSTTGFGNVGPRTRVYINQLLTQAKYPSLGQCLQLKNLTGQLKFTFTRNLKISSTGQDVKNLQIFLNNRGFIVAISGFGSKGNESTYFGPATQKALIKFQEYYAKDVLIPNGLTKGTGFFGPATIRKVNTL